VASVSSSSSVESAVRSGFQQLRVQEARRNAVQAEQAARALEAQARSAQRVADRADENARSLTVQSDSARIDAGRARQGLAYLDSASRSVQQLGDVAVRVAERQRVADDPSPPAAVPAAVSAPPVAPVVNAQGQLTGTLVSTTA
jgi:hypothetical protein